MLGIGLNRDFIYTVFSLDFKKVSGNDLGLNKKTDCGKAPWKCQDWLRLTLSLVGDSDKGLLVSSKLSLYWEFIGMSFLQRRPIWRRRTGHNSRVCARLQPADGSCFSASCVTRGPFIHTDGGLHLCMWIP